MAHNPDLNDLVALYEQLEAEPEPPQERRQHPRSPATGHVPATLEIANTPGSFPVTIRDMSRSGIGLFSPQLIPIGTTVTVGFRLRTGPVRATCRVVNARKDPNSGRHILGLALTDIHRPQPHPAPAPSPSADAPEGNMLSAADAMAGADMTAVNDVVQRIAKALTQS